MPRSVPVEEFELALAPKKKDLTLSFFTEFPELEDWSVLLCRASPVTEVAAREVEKLVAQARQRPPRGGMESTTTVQFFEKDLGVFAAVPSFEEHVMVFAPLYVFRQAPGTLGLCAPEKSVLCPEVLPLKCDLCLLHGPESGGKPRRELLFEASENAGIKFCRAGNPIFSKREKFDHEIG